MVYCCSSTHLVSVHLISLHHLSLRNVGARAYTHYTVRGHDACLRFPTLQRQWARLVFILREINAAECEGLTCETAYQRHFTDETLNRQELKALSLTGDVSAIKNRRVTLSAAAIGKALSEGYILRWRCLDEWKSPRVHKREP